MIGSWANSKQILHSKSPASLKLLPEQDVLWGGTLVDSPKSLAISVATTVPIRKHLEKSEREEKYAALRGYKKSLSINRSRQPRNSIVPLPPPRCVPVCVSVCARIVEDSSLFPIFPFYLIPRWRAYAFVVFPTKLSGSRTDGDIAFRS
ncbi:unnamed protein product [Malus baccata var. baccata]